MMTPPILMVTVTLRQRIKKILVKEKRERIMKKKKKKRIQVIKSSE